MTLPVKTITQLTTDQVATWANSIGLTPALAPGDALLAVFQAVAGQLDFIQSQVQLVLALTRAQTSTGADLDSWMAQFAFVRLLAVAAEGTVTFTKLTPAVNQVLIPAGVLTAGVYTGGALVQTTGGAVQYQVIPDTTQPTYNTGLNAYVLATGQTSLAATVQALTAGTSGNVAAGTIAQIASTLAGIDQVTNGIGFTNGVNAESDASFLARFPLYLASLAKATASAILYAATSVQQGITAVLLENETGSGSTLAGAFTVVVNNNSGNPPSGLLAEVYTAVYATRAFTVQPFVIGPTVIQVPIALDVRVAAGYVASVVEAAVQAAIVALVNATLIGAVLFISAVEGAALGVSGVLGVKPANTTINGTQADYTPTNIQLVQTTLTAVSVGTY